MAHMQPENWRPGPREPLKPEMQKPKLHLGMGYIGVKGLGFYRDHGKENGKYYFGI